MDILLADDHAMVRDGLMPFLERVTPDAKVVEAGTLDEALDKASKCTQLGLAILDLNMPGMDGLNGLSAMLKAHPQVPVVILSGSTHPADAYHSIEAGADGFIPKTMRGETIIGVLRLVLAGEKYVPPYLFDYQHTKPGQAKAPTDANAPLSGLSTRERDILALIVDGAPNKAIARALDLQEVTVKAHLRNIFRKLAVSNRTEAARTAILAGITGSGQAPQA
ncbi:response regulator transcription factor [Magnetospirillum sp. 64-120]|uniref:response regulator n=1 Tax=Magnetospirillum sp. 64-120 TaxID=1895778 RepID=UPI000927EE0F|nr:response regulator transcription factor [Magnetospirillum sp. 64-120]OJX76771.1 MAG: hypothetical protein BGO92_10820 [Magnetospirillum sp. 64-120]